MSCPFSDLLNVSLAGPVTDCLGPQCLPPSALSSDPVSIVGVSKDINATSEGTGGNRIYLSGSKHGGPGDCARAGEPRAARFRPYRFRSVSPAPQGQGRVNKNPPHITDRAAPSGAASFFASGHSNQPGPRYPL